MVVFGLILLLLGIGAGAFAIWVATSGAQTVAPGGGTAMAVDVLGNTLEVSILTLVLLGVGAVLLTLLGFWVMMAASRRKMRQSKERRELRKTQKRQEKELAETRSKLGDERPVATPEPRAEARPEPRTEVHRDTALGSEQTFDERTAPRYEETYRPADDTDRRGDVR